MGACESEKIGGLLKKLLAATPQKFPKARGRLDAPKSRGVYVIYGPRGGVEHVGSTPWAKNGIHQRLSDHMAGRSSYTEVRFDNEGWRLRSRYSFSYLVVEDGRSRALLEALAIGRLCPKHIGHGHNAEVLS